MRSLRRIFGGLLALVRQRRAEQDLDDEVQEYFACAADDRARGGMTADEARRVVRAEMGSIAAVKDYTRDAGWETTVEGIWRDVRHAFRLLRKSPAFTSTAVLTLALGIGATTAIFSLMDAVMLKSLPVRNPGELVVVMRSGHYPAFEAFHAHTDTFVNLLGSGGITQLDAEIQGGPREPANVSLVSGSYFATLGVAATLGRTFTEDDDRVPGQHPVAVLGYGYWERRFGRDPRVLGQTLRVSGTSITVIGVAPAGFFGEEVGVAPDAWVPLTMWGHIVPGRNLLQSRGTAWLRIVGRLRPDANIAQANAKLTSTFQRVLGDIFGPSTEEDVRREIAAAKISLTPADKGVSSIRTRFAQPLQLLMGAVVLVLLIACANIANLLLARAAARRREIDVRLALGMSRARLMRQLFTESLVLAGLGGAVGVAFAWVVTEGLLRLISEDGSRLAVAVTVDARLLAFATATSLTAAVLFGFAPAWRSTRRGVAASLVVRRDSGGGPRQRLSAVLVVAQVALSLVLLMGAGLFVRTIGNLRAVDLGFAPEQLVVADVNPQAAGYTGDRAVTLTLALLDRIAAAPGVASVTVAENALLMGRDSSTNQMRPQGFAAGPDGFPRSQWDVVGPRYFSTIGTPVIRGRDFTDQDRVGSPLVMAINEEMARLFFGDGDPIGRRFVWGEDAAALEIIAVVRDVKPAGPRNEPHRRFYLPYLQMSQIRPGWIVASTRYLVRSQASPLAMAAVLREVIPALDPRLSIADLEIGTELVSRTLVKERMVAVLLVAFGVLAVGLACLGLYGLIAYNVVQRTAEIGIRMALGARRGDILWLTLRRGMLWIAAGVTVGVPLALSASRVVQGLLFGLTATDIASLAAAIGLMSAIGILAAYVPARRAARIDPLSALRCE